MKQFMFLAVVTVIGGMAALVHPFWGVLLYYVWAVLRPQHLWQWALPMEVRWSLLAAGIAACGVFINLNRLNVRQGFGLMNQLLAVFSFCLMISVVNAHFPAIAQYWGVEYAKILIMAVILTLVIDRAWQVNVLALGVLAAVGYIAWEVNVLYLLQGRLDIFHHGYGGLDNNGAGLMIAMGIPLAYVFATTAPKLWHRGAAAFAGVLMIHAVMMTYSRGAMLSILIASVWVLLHHRPRLHAAGIAAVLVLVASLLAGQEIRQRLVSTTGYQQDDSAQSRFASWAAAWDMTWDVPLTGKGLRNANEFTYTYGADRQGRTIHSQYLQICADSGIPALGVYLMILTVALYSGSQARVLCRRYQETHPGDPPHGDAPHPDFNVTVRQMEALSLGCQASLICFAFGGLFLSLEVFEMPWLLIALLGVWPSIVHRHLTALAAAPASNAAAANPAAQPRQGDNRPIRWSKRRRQIHPSMRKGLAHP